MQDVGTLRPGHAFFSGRGLLQGRMPVALQGARTLRPIPLRLGSPRRLWMGQTVPSTTLEQISRLDDLPVDVIRSRGQLLFDVDTERQRRPRDVFEHRNPTYKPVSIWDWTPEQKAVLQAVAADPRPSELADLRLVDGFFNGTSRFGLGLARGDENAAFVDVICGEQGWGGSIIKDLPNPVAITRYGRGWNEVLRAARANPFYCPGAAPIPYPKSMYLYSGDLPKYFGISRTEDWGKAKIAVMNAITFLKVLENYPFPSPISVRPQTWYYWVQKDLQKIVNEPFLVSEDLARLYVTVGIVNTYNEVADKITRDLKKKEKRAKRKRIIKAIGLTLTLGVITAGIATALAGVVSATVVQAGMNAVKTGISVVERREAAQKLEEVAKLFAESDAGFSREVQTAADMLDAIAAYTERNAPLDPEAADAIAEGQVEQEYSPATEGEQFDIPVEPDTNWAAIGGVGAGVLAAGVGAFLLLR